jgi:hypothetical protein
MKTQAAILALLCLAGCSGCCNSPPAPTPSNAARFMLSIVDARGNVIARQSFGEANRGQTIVLTDTESDMHHSMDMDAALNWCRWWAGK